MNPKKDRPILFSAPMVRALLDGTKTQTRRIVKLRQFAKSPTSGYDWTFRGHGGCWQDYRADRIAEASPYGVVGDRLWVREAWNALRFVDGRAITADKIPEGRGNGLWFPFYAATFDRSLQGTVANEWDPKWRPSLHMPKWACRMVLDVEEIRVERLKDISEADAKAEGVELSLTSGSMNYRGAYANLWDEINGATHPWASNPYVWVISFRRLHCDGVPSRGEQR